MTIWHFLQLMQRMHGEPQAMQRHLTMSQQAAGAEIIFRTGSGFLLNYLAGLQYIAFASEQDT